MLVSEKSSHGSPGHGTGGTSGSTVDSSETRNSRDRSLAEILLLHRDWVIADHWTTKFKSCRSTRCFPSPINFDSEELLNHDESDRFNPISESWDSLLILRSRTKDLNRNIVSKTIIIKVTTKNRLKKKKLYLVGRIRNTTSKRYFISRSNNWYQ